MAALVRDRMTEGSRFRAGKRPARASSDRALADPVAGLGGRDRLVRDRHMSLERVELRVAVHFPPVAAGRRIARLGELPALGLRAVRHRLLEAPGHLRPGLAVAGREVARPQEEERGGGRERSRVHRLHGMAGPGAAIGSPAGRANPNFPIQLLRRSM